MPEINFLQSFHNTEDINLLRNMTNETIELYGFPCKLKKWTNLQPVLDPLYQDHSTELIYDDKFYDIINTYVYIDYNRFNQVLKSYGMALEDNTTLVGNMRYADEPNEDDIIEIKIPYDTRYITFKIGSADIHRDICYNVNLNVMYFSGR